MRSFSVPAELNGAQSHPRARSPPRRSPSPPRRSDRNSRASPRSNRNSRAHSPTRRSNHNSHTHSPPRRSNRNSHATALAAIAIVVVTALAAPLVLLALLHSESLRIIEK